MTSVGDVVYCLTTMKLINGKIEFELATCFLCDGKGITKRGIWCPNNNKVVGVGKKCPHCGSKNKRDHKILTWEDEQCYCCDGTGKKMEDKYSNLSEEILAQIPLRFQFGGGMSAFESYYGGKGLAGGCTDYGRTYDIYQKGGESAVIEHVKSDINHSCHQVLFYLNNDGKLCDAITICLTDNGYALRPFWNKPTE